MTDQSNAPRRSIDWEALEVHYRAGIRSLKDIGREFGVSDAAIIKRAKRDDWARDLKAKILAKAEAKVSAAAVSAVVSARTKATEQQVVEANAQVMASAALLQQEHLRISHEVSMGLLRELATLSRPDLAETLQAIGEAMDESTTNERGAAVADKINQAYRYVISIEGRLKMAKDAAAAIGVTLPLERKVLRLDAQESQGQTEVDSLLRRINEAGA